MLAHVVLAAAALTAAPTAPAVDLAQPAAVATVETSPDDPTPPTINEFIPEDRGLGECISALPKPGCGSDARGGWRQGLVLLGILLALGFIAWRVVRTSRRARAESAPAGRATLDADATHVDRNGA